MMRKDSAEGIRLIHGIPSQTQIKSALSTSSNIAEGRTKNSQREFLRFLDIALGSAGELEYQLTAAIDCGAIPFADGLEPVKRAKEVAKMTQGLINKIQPISTAMTPAPTVIAVSCGLSFAAAVSRRSPRCHLKLTPGLRRVDSINALAPPAGAFPFSSK
jgi:four helix bundle protein